MLLCAIFARLIMRNRRLIVTVMWTILLPLAFFILFVLNVTGADNTTELEVMGSGKSMLEKLEQDEPVDRKSEEEIYFAKTAALLPLIQIDGDDGVKPPPEKSEPIKPIQMRGTRFMLNNPYICKYGENDTVTDSNGKNDLETNMIGSSSSRPVLLIMVSSRRDHFKEREIVRNTYGTVYRYKNYDIRIIFLLGKGNKNQKNTNKDSIHVQIAWEFDRFGDIILGGFYERKETKSSIDKIFQHIMGIRWAIKFCERAKYVIKVNDDNFVDTLEVIDNLVPMLEKSQGSFLCSLRQGKVTTSENSANGKGELVKYCAGDAYLATIDAIKKLFVMAPQVPLFYKYKYKGKGNATVSEDIFITGKLRTSFIQRRKKDAQDTFGIISDEEAKRFDDEANIVPHEHLLNKKVCSSNEPLDNEQQRLGFHKLSEEDKVTEAWCWWRNALTDRSLNNNKEFKRISYISSVVS